MYGGSVDFVLGGPSRLWPLAYGLRFAASGVFF
jgi:hypothetical protein